MNKINLVYLHGFGSNNQTEKGILLKKTFSGDNFNVIVPNLPVDHLEAITLIKNILSVKGEFILIGTSLGGFYADFFNKIADVPCLLMNPLINPEQMERHIGTNKNYNSNLDFEYTKENFRNLIELSNKKNEDDYTTSPSYVLAAIDDEICDWKDASKFFTKDNHWFQKSPSGGHRFSNNKMFIDTLKELIIDSTGFDFASILNDEVYESKKDSNRLNERFLNLFQVNDKEKYFTEISDLINETYDSIGGFVGDINEFLTDKYFWKLVKRNGKIVAGKIYKGLRGRKSVCGFTDGSFLGKIELKNIVKEDIKLGRSWVEVSGNMENVYKYSAKATPMSRTEVEIIMKLINKEIISWESDNIHYSRIIKGKKLTKVMYGNYIEDFKGF